MNLPQWEALRVQALADLFHKSAQRTPPDKARWKPDFDQALEEALRASSDDIKMRQVTKAIVLWTVLLAGVLALAQGILPPNPKVVGAPIIVEPGRTGGTFNFPISPLSTLNPYVSGSIVTTSLMNAKLFEINPITFEIEPAVAEEHQIAPDGSALTLTLREIQFSDGTPLTADDVLFTINDVVLNTEIQSDRLSSLRQFLTSRDGQLMIQEAEKLDQRQLRLRLNGGVGAFVLKQLSENFVILPRHKLADSVRRLNPRASADAFVKAWSLQARPEEFAGLGPFRLKALKKTGIPLISEQISGLNFERNPFYWKADSNGVQLPYVDKVSLDFVANPRADIPAKIQAGQVDAALLEVDFMNVKIADGQNFLRAASQAGFSLIYQGPSLSTSFLAFNQDVPDEALRQVFREVRFRQAVAHLVDYERIEREALQNFGVARETFLRPESPFFDPQANVRFEFDPNRAAAHLDELGFKDTNGDGIRELPNGQPYHFYKFSDARGEDVADYQKRLDEILFEQAVELDRAKRRALSTEMQRLLSDNLPVIWLYSPATLVVARPTLGNTGAVKTIEAAFNLMETLWRKDQ